MERTLKRPEPTIVAHLFPSVLGRLLTLLRSLEDEEWTKPTACPGWSVKDVALHLLGDEIGNLSVRRDNHRPASHISGWDELVTYINHWNQEWVKVTRRISSLLLIDLMDFTGNQVCEYFQSLDPYAIGGPVSWAGEEPAPVWLDIAREYTERWHHQQHIRDAVGQPGLKEPQYFAPVLDAFAWALPRALRTTDAVEGATVTLTVRGKSGGQWSVRRERGDWTFYQGATDQPDAEFVIEEEVAWRLFTRGLSHEEARTRISLIGDEALALRVLDMVSIIA